MIWQDWGISPILEAATDLNVTWMLEYGHIQIMEEMMEHEKYRPPMETVNGKYWPWC